MGVSRSPEQLAAKFAAASRQMGFVNVDAVEAAAQTYKLGVEASGRADTGGDLKMRWNGRNIKLRARYRTQGQGATAKTVLSPIPPGVWSVLSNGAQPHLIAPRRGRGSRRRGGKSVLKFADGQFSARPVQHPGSKGKKTWQRGIRTAEPAAKKVFAAAHRRSLAKVFDKAIG